jgi:chromosome segregation ATPase
MSPLLTQYAISQLQTSKEAKENNAASAKQFMESNTQLRKEIQIIMQTLESKQQILDATRASTADKELQVKRLRDEALLSRKQLEELALKEKELLEARDSAIENTQRSEREHLILQESYGSMQHKYQNDIQQLQHDLEDLQAEFTKVRANSERSMNIMQNQIQQILDSRDELVSEADQLGLAIAGTHKLFAEKTTSQTKQLRNEMSLYLTQSEHIDRNVVGCRDEVNGLIMRVRNYANSNSAA